MKVAHLYKVILPHDKGEKVCGHDGGPLVGHHLVGGVTVCCIGLLRLQWSAINVTCKLIEWNFVHISIVCIMQFIDSI